MAVVDVVTRVVAEEEGGVEEEEQVVRGEMAAGRSRDGETREDRQGFVK